MALALTSAMFARQALTKRRAVAQWALMTIDALALALVPPQARQEAQLVRAPASLDAGHDTSPAKRGASGVLTRKVRQPIA